MTIPSLKDYKIHVFKCFHETNFHLSNRLNHPKIDQVLSVKQREHKHNDKEIVVY